MTAQILTSQFNSLYLAIEAAFGAAPGADGPWTDITADVRADPITITVGKADEASLTQPARCTLAVNNPTGRYNLGPQSPTQGVNHNIPMRVRAILNGTSYVRMQGELTELLPGWDETGKTAIANITISGPLRRLSGATKPVSSPMLHFVQAQSNLTAYWPCEDGSRAVSLASAIGGAPMVSSLGSVHAPATYAGFLGSSAVPVLGGESLSATKIASGGTSAGAQIWLLIHVPAATLLDQTRVATVAISCPALTRIDLLYSTALGGSFGFKAYQGSTLVATGAAANPPGGADNQNVLLGINWEPWTIAMDIAGGPDVLLDLEVCGLDAGGTGSTDATVASTAISAVTAITINPDVNMAGVAVGHVYLQNIALGLAVVPKAAIGFNTEAATDRVTRIATEQSEILAVTGASIQTMGVQPSATYVNVLREAEAVDIGVLYDGFGRGLSYIARDSRENQEPTITLDAAAKEIVSFPPYFDDLGLINSFQAGRTNGSTYTYADTTSALSVTAIGEHPASATINCATDDALPDYAGFKVGIGTVPGYRYPNLQLSMHGAPRILPGWLATTVSSRLDVKHLSSVRINEDPKDLSILVEGWTETITKHEWTAAVNVTSYEPWRIGVLAADTGDNGEFLARYDPDGSTVAGDTAAGSATLSVATPSGPLWVTGSGDDFPMDLDVGGLRVTCTGISGSSSPQTFTVAPLAMKVYNGWSVSTWRNPVLGR